MLSFFQKFWYIVGTDTVNDVLYALNSGEILKSINYTHIALIPKIKSLVTMSHIRPIGLRNVIYKLVSNVLTNKLKLVIPKIMYDSLSAFINERQIIDNILIAYEMIY
jgi:hypothetical protein